MIIGITGPARSGKDTVSKIITDIYTSYKIKSFAAPIRLIIANLIGITDSIIFDSIKDIPHILLNNKTPRYAMQTLGTEWGRYMISDTLWIDTCLNTNDTNIIISDVRFENEAKAIKEKNGIIIKVTRPNIKIQESLHISEKGISDDYIAYNIDNSGDINDLKQKVITIMECFCK